jgi:uncharacterized protein (TIGR00299 family) protein
MLPEAVSHVHLDPVGGIAGDMFTAAICHARPDLETGLLQALGGVWLPATARSGFADDRRAGIAGRRFSVEVEESGHASGTFRAIRDRLRASALDEPVRERAIAILTLLAEAEGRIHGVPVESVHFHELADWDSIADVVAAAWLIEALGRPSWSIACLPLGSGRVRAAHGSLPIPAPATALLLEGLPVHDDGIGGERVTPTGAAIVRHLAPRPRVPGRPLRILATGHGLGSREIEGLPNMLRALLLAEEEAAVTGSERIGVIRFEVDDQTAEDLALGLDRVRALAQVRDVCQWPAIGKRGRMGVAVQVLCAAEALERIADACLAETSTIGLRLRIEARRVLERRSLTTSVGDVPVEVKTVVRPNGERSAKAEMASLEAAAGSFATRAGQRRAGEARALEEER